MRCQVVLECCSHQQQVDEFFERILRRIVLLEDGLVTESCFYVLIIDFSKLRSRLAVDECIRRTSRFFYSLNTKIPNHRLLYLSDPFIPVIIKALSVNGDYLDPVNLEFFGKVSYQGLLTDALNEFFKNSSKISSSQKSRRTVSVEVVIYSPTITRTV